MDLADDQSAAVRSVGMHLFERWGGMHLQPRGSLDDPAKLAILPQMISVTEQSNNLTYRNAAQANNTLVPNYAMRAAVSYVTGSHSVKFGVNDTWGFLNPRQYTPSALPVSYRFNSGIPNQITLRALPLTTKTDQKHGSRSVHPGSLDDEPAHPQRGAAVRLLQDELARADRHPVAADAATATSRSPRPTSWRGRTSRSGLASCGTCWAPEGRR